MADDMTASEYADPMSDRLLGIAADVLRSFGGGFGGRHLAVVGGAVPGLLVPVPPPGIAPHVGTADLDLHLALHLLDGETADYYRSIIDGLRSLGLHPDDTGGHVTKWRWVGLYRGVRLRVELLCPSRGRPGRPEAPASGTPAEANIGPAGEITALALGFGHLVPGDTMTIARRVAAKDGELAYEFPVAGLASWLSLKADAIMRRDKPKDAYDVVWVLDALGPDSASRHVAESALFTGNFAGDAHMQLRRLAHDQFRDPESIGPRQYARFLEVRSGDAEHRHAVGTVVAFESALRACGIELAS